MPFEEMVSISRSISRANDGSPGGGNHHFDHKNATARGHGIAAVAQDRLAPGVVPVVEDVLEHIGVATGGDRGEEVTAYGLD
ncbi:MAG TPA: hypothetical protein VGY91_05315 [Chthoniobacterales bacterium]|nr:hypothetical protein [Chthoniobacterales bacterium]